MSYAEAKKDRRRQRKNEQMGLILAALGHLGRTITGEIQSRRESKDRRDLETLRQSFEEKQLDKKLMQDETQSRRSSETQLQVADKYASSRGDNESAWEAAAEADENDPALVEYRGQTQSLRDKLKDADFMEQEGILGEIESRDKGYTRELQRARLRQRKASKGGSSIDQLLQQSGGNQSFQFDHGGMDAMRRINSSGGGAGGMARGERQRSMQEDSMLQAQRGRPLPQQPTNQQESNPSRVQGQGAPGTNQQLQGFLWDKFLGSFQRFMDPSTANPLDYQVLQEFSGGALPPLPGMSPMPQPLQPPQR